MSSAPFSLPADLDLKAPDAMLHPSEPRLVPGGSNRAWRIGDRFVKNVSEIGSPFAGPAVSRMFVTLGLPHVPVEYQFHRGRHYVHMPFVEADNLARVRPHHRESITPANIASTLFGEWVANVSDRHSGNYHITPHGAVSIDHDIAIAPAATADWGKPHSGWYGERLTDNPQDAAINPYDSHLFHLLHQLHGLTGHTVEVPPEVVDRALAHRQQLRRHAEAGLAGIDDAEKAAALAAFDARMDQIQENKDAGRTLTLGRLLRAGDRVRERVGSLQKQ